MSSAADAPEETGASGNDAPKRAEGSYGYAAAQ